MLSSLALLTHWYKLRDSYTQFPQSHLFFSCFFLVFCSQTVMTSSWPLFCFWVAWRVTLQRYKKRHGISILLPRVIQNLTCVLAVSEKRFKSCHIAQESGHSFLIWSSVYCSCWLNVTTKFPIMLEA